MTTPIKNYFGLIRDHTASMTHIARHAARDYNNIIEALKASTLSQNQDTVAYVMQCGIGRPAANIFAHVNSSIAVLQPIPENSYDVSGNSTPLFDAVGDTIEALKKVPDYNDPNVSFVVMITTDGGDNSSRKYSGTSISTMIRELQLTDRWTFVFRVPENQIDSLKRWGIPSGNIIGWDTHQASVERTSVATVAAVQQYMNSRSVGTKSSNNFFQTADLTEVSAKKINSTLDNITKEVQVYDVAQADHDAQIRPFIESKIGVGNMLKGGCFYELTKKEKVVQPNKLLIIQNKTSEHFYSGTKARQILGLPTDRNVAVEPGDHGNFRIFVQSTSVNRKLVSGTKLVYWSNVGSAFVGSH